jgi:hypothetical protein
MLTSYTPVRSPMFTAGRSFALVLALLAALPMAAPIAQQVEEDTAHARAPWGHVSLAIVRNQADGNDSGQSPSHLMLSILNSL